MSTTMAVSGCRSIQANHAFSVAQFEGLPQRSAVKSGGNCGRDTTSGKVAEPAWPWDQHLREVKFWLAPESLAIRNLARSPVRRPFRRSGVGGTTSNAVFGPVSAWGD